MPRIPNIALWLVNLDSEISNIKFHTSVIHKSELIRSGKFLKSYDTNRFIVRRSCLRLVLSYYIDTSPENIRFKYNQYGKPFIANERFFFNTSHSGLYAVVAIMKDYECGTDIESKNHHFNDREHELFLSPIEREQLQDIESDNINSYLIRTWVQKEAVLKTLGTGLSISPTKYTISNDSLALPTVKDPTYKKIFLQNKCINDSYYISVASYKQFNHVFINHFVCQ